MHSRACAWGRHPGIDAIRRHFLAWLTMAVLAFIAVPSAFAQPRVQTSTADEPVQTIHHAQAVASNAPTFPRDVAPTPVTLPDEWWASRPKDEGPVWYRLRFNVPAGQTSLMAAYIERVCSTADVYLNGAIVMSGGPMTEPLPRNCYYPQLVTLPTQLLKPEGNVLDIQVHGYPLQKVSSRKRSGGLSAVQVGPFETLVATHANQLFWNVTAVKAMTVALLVLGIYMLYLGWLNRQDVHFGYFGLLTLTWAVLSARIWWLQFPFSNHVAEFISCAGFAVAVAAAVQFLLSYAALRSRTLELVLLLQIVLLPLTLAVAGPWRLFVVSSAWHLLISVEVLAAVGLYLGVTWRTRPKQFWFMTAVCGAICALLALEAAVQNDMVPLPHVPLLPVAMPVLFMIIGARLLRGFGRALQVSEADRMSLESRVLEAKAEIERNFEQMAQLRVDQVTEKERKRIAADLHDDLGAKLLTIVHTSESERISSLAREALEEMRLSVRGLTGKPMQVADALADWRAETVLRLGQANIEADWTSPTDEVTQQLPARTFVQTTRILREAVSNIIKHSGASACKVRCDISENDFSLVIQDNGKGISMELDGKLDRGHGMASMKHRAKQMQGQCLVESGPGYGTVIRLTLPL